MPSVDVPAARSRNPKPDLYQLFGVGHRGVNKRQAIRRQVPVRLVRARVGQGTEVDERGLVMLSGSQLEDLRVRRKLRV